MIEWIAENKDWVFSGAGIALLSLLATVASRVRSKRLKVAVSGGDGSINFGDNATVKTTILLPTSDSSTSVEQYRGNLISKFAQLFKTLNDAIREIENASSFQIHLDGTPREAQADYLRRFESLARDVEKRVSAALDQRNIVLAHETLNELREAAIKAAEERNHHHQLYKISTMLSTAACDFHGTQRRLRDVILKSLSSVFEIKIAKY